MKIKGLYIHLTYFGLKRMRISERSGVLIKRHELELQVTD